MYPMKQRKEPNHSSREKNPVSSLANMMYHGSAFFSVKAFFPNLAYLSFMADSVRP